MMRKDLASTVTKSGFATTIGICLFADCSNNFSRSSSFTGSASPEESPKASVPCANIKSASLTLSTTSNPKPYRDTFRHILSTYMIKMEKITGGKNKREFIDRLLQKLTLNKWLYRAI